MKKKDEKPALKKRKEVREDKARTVSETPDTKHAEKVAEIPKEDPRDKKIRDMRGCLINLRDNVLSGNPAHVASIEAVLRD